MKVLVRCTLSNPMYSFLKKKKKSITTGSSEFIVSMCQGIVTCIVSFHPYTHCKDYLIKSLYTQRSVRLIQTGN